MIMSDIQSYSTLAFTQRYIVLMMSYLFAETVHYGAVINAWVVALSQGTQVFQVSLGFHNTAATVKSNQAAILDFGVIGVVVTHL